MARAQLCNLAFVIPAPRGSRSNLDTGERGLNPGQRAFAAIPTHLGWLAQYSGNAKLCSAHFHYNGGKRDHAPRRSA